MLQIEDFKKKIMNNSRLLGLDIGKKRIGVAICDDKRIIATPYKTIIKENFDQFLSELLIIIKDNNITFSENRNGVFVNLNNLPNKVIDKIYKYLDYVKIQEKNIATYEKED